MSDIKEKLQMLKITTTTATSFISNSTINKHFDCYEKKRLQEEFEELRTLGEGGFGRVILVKNKFDDMEYAVKMIPTTEKLAQKIKNEIAVLSKLEHENVVRYFGSWSENVELKKANLDALLEESSDNIVFEDDENVAKDDNKNEIQFSTDNDTDGSSLLGEVIKHKVPDKIIYIQMEYCKNKTLRELIQTEGLLGNIRLLWWLFREIMRGVEFIHSKNIIHRDIKPENIFLNDGHEIFKFKVKIGDFGLSTPLTENMHPPITYAAGTKFYIAPEILRGEHFDQKSDIYSLGKVFFEMSYYLLNVKEPLVKFLFNYQLNENTFPDGFINEKKIRELIRSMLQVQPENRLSSKEVLNFIPVTDITEDQKSLTKALIKTDTPRFLLNNFFDKTRSLYVHSPAFTNGNLMLTENKSYIKAINDMKQIFILHGLHERIPAILNTYDNDKRELQVPIMDHEGTVLALSSNLHQTFAQFSAKWNSFSSFAFGTLIGYEVGRYGPIQKLECAVDMIAPVHYVSSIESDLCLLIKDIMKYYSKLKDVKYYVRISHAKILEAILDIFHCRDDLPHIQKNCSPSCIDCRLNVNVSKQYKDSFYSALWLKENDVKIYETKLFAAKDEMKYFITNELKEMNDFAENIKSLINDENIEIIFASYLCYKPEIFDGICFTIEGTFRSSHLPIIGGGRFDQFLASHRTESDDIPLCSYGIDIFLDTLNTIQMAFFRSFFVPHVLIYPEEYRKEAATLKNHFRANNYPASINYEDNLSVEQLKEICETECIPYLIIITNINEVVIYADTRFASSLQKSNDDDNYFEIQMGYDEAVGFVISTSPK